MEGRRGVEKGWTALNDLEERNKTKKRNGAFSPLWSFGRNDRRLAFDSGRLVVIFLFVLDRQLVQFADAQRSGARSATSATAPHVPIRLNHVLVEQLDQLFHVSFILALDLVLDQFDQAIVFLVLKQAS